jgi:hypothetical protein
MKGLLLDEASVDEDWKMVGVLAQGYSANRRRGTRENPQAQG